MKKLYSTLALAALVCASASAAKFDKTVAGKAAMQTIESVEYAGMSQNPEKSAPNRAASLSDFLGYFSCEYTWPFSSSDPGTSVSIQLVEGNTVAMTFSPWAIYSNVDMDPVIATIDVNAGTITINTAANSNLGVAHFSDGDEGICWRAQDLVSDGQGGTNRVPKEETVGHLNADGTISFGGINEICGFGIIGKDTNWLGAFRDLVFVAPDYFKYNADEWESAGTATFEEYLINPLLQSPIGGVEVPVLKSKTEEGAYLLVKPYSCGDWTQVNENTGSEGFIYINMACPDCVWVRPLTASGLWLDLGSETEPDVSQFYIYNLEGSYVFYDEADPEEIAEVLEEEGTQVSKFDAATGKANIVNVYFGDSSNPGASYTWTTYKNLSLTVTFNGLGAVDGILNDAENVPARYFNLQGVEIANPEAGQLVIVKEGKKATKTIVK